MADVGITANMSSSGSESSSTEEEERLRRLFVACDRDGDGLIDSHDLVHMCRLLNMEDAVDEIKQHLDVDSRGRISFDDFLSYRTQLLKEIEFEEKLERLKFGDDSLIEDNSDINIGAVGGGHDEMQSITRKTSEDIFRENLVDQDSRHVISLYQLLESNEPEIFYQYTRYLTKSNVVVDILHIANSLHMEVVSSLKCEVIDLNSRLGQLRSDKDMIEKQLSKLQADRSRCQNDSDERLEQQMVRYEDRIIELHSVIAELRKKIDCRQINVIREEEEFEDSDRAEQSNKSVNEGSLIEAPNNPFSCLNEAPNNPFSLGDVFSNLTAELTQAVLDCSRDKNDKSNRSHDQSVSPTFSKEDKSVQTSSIKESRAEQKDSRQVTDDVGQLMTKIQNLVKENDSLIERLEHNEARFNQFQTQLSELRNERDTLKRKVQDLQIRSFESRDATSVTKASSPITDSRSCMTQLVSVAKVAELKKLKTGKNDRLVLGSEISSSGVSSAMVAEHLTQSLYDSSSVQELLCPNNGSARNNETVYSTKVREFEIELERLQCRVGHLRTQNDLLKLTLEESKCHCDRLTVLIGKYESNNTALQMSVNYSDQALEIYDVLVNLLDTQLAMLFVKCRSSGIFSRSDLSLLDISTSLQKTQLSRRHIEHVAKQLLMRLDRFGDASQVPSCKSSPWEDVSSNSRTASTSSIGSWDEVEFSKPDEDRLREHLNQLKTERAVVKMTVMELESVHLDPFELESEHSMENAQKLDLENAVIMQELMAVKEEKVELKSQNYLLEKEKTGLELLLNGKESQIIAYLLQIQQLKQEITEFTQRNASNDDGQSFKNSMIDESNKNAQSTEQVSCNRTEGSEDRHVSYNLAEALKREEILKSRVQELRAALEKLSKTSEQRHQQSAGFVNELKQANSSLVCAFEKAKKKYLNKMKKMETQLQSITEHYETQIQMMNQKILLLENQHRKPHCSNFTSGL